MAVIPSEATEGSDLVGKESLLPSFPDAPNAPAGITRRMTPLACSFSRSRRTSAHFASLRYLFPSFRLFLSLCTSSRHSKL